MNEFLYDDSEFADEIGWPTAIMATVVLGAMAVFDRDFGGFVKDEFVGIIRQNGFVQRAEALFSRRTDPRMAEITRGDQERDLN